MRTDEFRAWLKARRWNGKPLTSVGNRISKARRFEKAMPALGLADADLDAAFEADAMERVTDYLRQTYRNARATGEAPAELVGVTVSAAARLANVAAAVGNYRQFRESEAMPASDWPALDELRAVFLDRVPEFERFDRTDNEYERVERLYKDKIIAEVGTIVSSADDDEAAGRRIFRALIPDEGPLLRWQTDDDFARKFPALAPAFYAAIGRLARDTGPVADAIMAAADTFAQLRQAGATTLTLGEIVSVAFSVAGMARPTEAVPFKILKAQQLGKLLIDDPIFAGSVLERVQVERWLALLRRIEAVMRDEWHWHPRDLVDVQGFAWAALDDKWKVEDEMDDDALLARFRGSALFRTMQASWTAEQTAAFCAMARAAHDAGLDWYHTNMPHNPVRLGRKPDRDRRAKATLGYVDRHATPRIWLNDKPGRPQVGRHAFPLDSASAEAFAEALQRHASTIAAWEAPLETRVGRWPDEAGFEEDDTPDAESKEPDAAMTTTNLILYGPPGTGKTYATAAHAVRLCDGLAPNDPLLGTGRRNALMERYAALAKEGRIEFVTFHQSIAYEEFVEGLRPETASAASEDGGAAIEPAASGFRLRPRDGIFKQVSEHARLSTTGTPTHLDRRRNVFKIALGRRGEEENRIAEGLDRGMIHLGWGGEIDWTDERFDSFQAIKRHWQEEVDPAATGKDPNVEMMYTFRGAMELGDYVILSDGRDLVRGVAEITGEYRYDAAASFHPHRRAVRWLWRDATGISRDRFYPRQFRRHSTYQLDGDVIDWDALDGIVFGAAASNGGGGLPHVLVIDEINRANISKVFGELITLLEADKRIGAANELRVRLPYSGDAFGVPANLHIIGTMNTADRSIALLDTALRRRFAFEELMPRADLLETIDDIDLSKLLTTLNDGIEYLFDREHQIGHAYFLPCRTRAEIDQVMRHKVIPLLAEYFYEDWTKVAAVLGDVFEDDGRNRKGGFLVRRALRSPLAAGEGEEVWRYRWTVRDVDTFDYGRLTGAA